MPAARRILSCILPVLSLFNASVTSASVLGMSCSAPLGPGNAAPGEPYWLQRIKHQGTAPYAASSNYTVFRNIKDYGAIGNGIADDTEAIKYVLLN